jgi:hypothetical protein
MAECWAPGRGKEGQGPKGKGKGKGKGKEIETAAATAPKQESEDQAWMVNAEANVLGFAEEGLNISQVINNKVVEGGANHVALSSLIGLILQGPTNGQPSVDISKVVDLLADLFETPTTPSNKDIWLSDNNTMPDLATASDSSDKEDKNNGDELSGSKTLLDTDDNDDDMPGLQAVSDSEDEGDNEDKGNDSNDFCSELLRDLDEYEVVELDGEVYTHTFVADDITKGTSTSLGSDLIDIELYDSGASRHMTGYRHCLINYQSIPPKPITATDKRSFNAIGKGDMHITVPNGDNIPTCILLRDVLYAPLMGVTLVLVSCIAIAGSMLVFQDSTCHIYHKDKTCIGIIKVKNGLNHVFTPCPETATSISSQDCVHQ